MGTIILYEDHYFLIQAMNRFAISPSKRLVVLFFIVGLSRYLSAQLTVEVTDRVDLKSNLELHLKLDGDFVNRTDYSGILSPNRVQFAEDRFGNSSHALATTGVKDSFLSIPEFAGAEGQFLTVSFWFYCKHLSETGSRIQKLVTKDANGDGAASLGRQWFMSLVGNNGKHELRWSVGTQRNSHNIFASEVEVVDGQWHHAVGQWDGGNTRLWLDGKLLGALTKINDSMVAGNAPIKLGADPYYGFNGHFDDLRIYSRMLNGSEVKDLYSQEKNGLQDLVAGGLADDMFISVPVNTTVEFVPQTQFYSIVDAEEDGTSWDLGKADAELRGEQLASIVNGAKQVFIEDMFSTWGKGSGLSYAIGGSNREGNIPNKDDWSWLNGRKMFYSNWGREEPTNLSSDERILTFTTGGWVLMRFGEWNNDHLSNKHLHGYISEYPNDGLTIIQQPKNGVVQVLGDSFIYTPNNNYTGDDSFYYLAKGEGFLKNIAEIKILVAEGIAQAKSFEAIAGTWTFQEAKADAVLLGGYLASIPTAADQNVMEVFLGGLEPAMSTGYFIGGTDVAVEGNWQWMDGASWEYSNWQAGEPNNCCGGEEGLEIYPSDKGYKWNDVAVAPSNTSIDSPRNGYVFEKILKITPYDSDQDGLSDIEERDLGTDPYLADTDGDGLNDKEEIDFRSNPLVVDTEGDSFDDYVEYVKGTDPNVFDIEHQWDEPSSIVYGVNLTQDAFLISTSTEGSFSYPFGAPQAGDLLPAGNRLLTVLFTANAGASKIMTQNIFVSKKSIGLQSGIGSYPFGSSEADVQIWSSDLVQGDSMADLDNLPSLDFSQVNFSESGTYAVLYSAATDDNYQISAGSFTITILPPVDESIKQGLMGHYPLYVDALDYSGQGKHGEIQGQVTFPIGNYGHFDGESLIKLPEMDALVSISAWIHCDVEVPQMIFSTWLGGNNSGQFDYGLNLRSKEGIGVVSSGSHIYGQPVLQSKQWTHVVMISEGNDSTFYVNGVRVDALSESWLVNMLAEAVLDHASFIGGPSYSEQIWFKGNMRNVRLYEKVLTELEVDHLYEVESVPAFENKAPTAQDSQVLVTQNSQISILLQATDPEGAPLSYNVVGQPLNGGIDGTPPNLIYTPTAGFVGQDLLTFKASDGEWQSDLATIIITVEAEIKNSPPVAKDASYSTDANISVAITLEAVDADGGKSQ